MRLLFPMDTAGRTITLLVPTLAREAFPFNQRIIASTLRLVDKDVQTWSRYDNGCVLTFRRELKSP